MILVNFLARHCRRSVEPVQLEPQQSALEKRIYSIVLKHIGNEFLTHANRANLSACCRSLRGFVETLPKQQEFAKILPLVSGRCRMTPLQNTELNRQSVFDKEHTLTFNAFDYDPTGQVVMTGDHGDYDNVTVKLWNRRGEMIRQLTNPREFFKSINSVSLDLQRSRALASAGSSDGHVKVWDLRTGEMLFSQQPFGPNLALCTASFATSTILAGSSGGNVQLIDLSRPYVDQPVPDLHGHRGTVWWICDLPEIDRIFCCGEILKIWDRTEKTCLATYEDVPCLEQHKHYDPTTRQLYVRSDRKYVRVIDGVTGKAVKEFRDTDAGVLLTSLHYDSIKKWLFAGFTYDVDRFEGDKVIKWGRAKIVIWDAEHGNRLHSFVTAGKDGLCNIPTQIDFDPKSEMILNAGHDVQLWDLSGRLMREFLPGGNEAHVRWDKENRLLVIFKSDGTLNLVDYAAPQQGPAQERRESKKP